MDAGPTLDWPRCARSGTATQPPPPRSVPREGSGREGRLSSQQGDRKREVTAAQVSDTDGECGHHERPVTDEAAKEEAGSSPPHAVSSASVCWESQPARPVALVLGRHATEQSYFSGCWFSTVFLRKAPSPPPNRGVLI